MTSWMDGVGEWGTYWTDESVDKTEMWRAWQLLNSSRSWMAKVASSLMAVGVSGGVDARELMDGLELPDILYLW